MKRKNDEVQKTKFDFNDGYFIKKRETEKENTEEKKISSNNGNTIEEYFKNTYKGARDPNKLFGLKMEDFQFKDDDKMEICLKK
jgi:hypothetical protein